MNKISVLLVQPAWCRPLSVQEEGNVLHYLSCLVSFSLKDTICIRIFPFLLCLRTALA